MSKPHNPPQLDPFSTFMIRSSDTVKAYTTSAIFFVVWVVFHVIGDNGILYVSTVVGAAIISIFYFFVGRNGFIKQRAKLSEYLGVGVDNEDLYVLMLWQRRGVLPDRPKLTPVLGRYIEYRQGMLDGSRWAEYTGNSARRSLLVIYAILILLTAAMLVLIPGPSRMLLGLILLMFGFFFVLTYQGIPGKPHWLHRSINRRGLRQVAAMRKRLEGARQ